MPYKLFHDSFMEALRNAVPMEQDLIRKLIEIIGKRPMTVWKKLRGEEEFTMEEVAAICKATEISLEGLPYMPLGNLFNTNFGFYTFDDLKEKDFVLMEKVIGIYQSATISSDNTMIFACNMIPDVLFLKFENLTKFFRLKWQYYLTKPGKRNISYEEIYIGDRYRQIATDYVNSTKNFNNLVFIWDRDVIGDIVKDIKYFYSISLISKKQLAGIKKDLVAFVDMLTEMIERGYWADPKSKLLFALSATTLQNFYTLTVSDKIKMAMFHAFYLNYIYTSEEDTVNAIETWLNALLRNSTIISRTNETERKKFIESQYRLFDELDDTTLTR